MTVSVYQPVKRSAREYLIYSGQRYSLIAAITAVEQHIGFAPHQHHVVGVEPVPYDYPYAGRQHERKKRMLFPTVWKARAADSAAQLATAQASVEMDHR